MNTTHRTPAQRPAAWARVTAAAVLLAFGCSIALAEKPEWAGKGNPHGQSQKPDGHGPGKGKPDKHDRAPAAQSTPRIDIRIGGYFAEPQRSSANTYYAQQFRGGHCPPGLAKKNNGCLPPGQAKKYVIGQPLPAGVVYYPVPQPVVVQLGAPPAGYRYVRVAADILLIAVGTSMVVDAIQDLGRI